MTDLTQNEPDKQATGNQIDNPQGEAQAGSPPNQPETTPCKAENNPPQDAPQGVLTGAGVSVAELLDTNALLLALGVSRNALKQWTKAGLTPDSIGKNDKNKAKYFWKLENVKAWLSSRGNFEAILKKEQGKQATDLEQGEGIDKPEKIGFSKKELNRIDKDFETVLKRTRLMEQRSFENYEKELATGNDLKILLAQKNYLAISKQRTDIEKHAPDILKKQGKVIDKGEVEKQIIAISQAIKNEFLSIPQKLSSKLENKTATEISGILKTELNDILRHLSELK